MKRLLAIALAATVAASALAAQNVSATAQQTSQPSQPAAASRGRTVDGVMASVNDQVISHSDVRNRMRWMMLRFAEPPKDEKILLELQNQALESLIDEEGAVPGIPQAGEGRRLLEEEIDEAVADVARQYPMTPDKFALAIAQAGIPMQHIRDMEEASIAWSNLIRGRYFKTVRVSELRIDDMLHRLKTSLDKPQYRLADDFLYAPDQASRDMAKERAATIIDNVKKARILRPRRTVLRRPPPPPAAASTGSRPATCARKSPKPC